MKVLPNLKNLISTHHCKKICCLLKLIKILLKFQKQIFDFFNSFWDSLFICNDIIIVKNELIQIYNFFKIFYHILWLTMDVICNLFCLGVVLILQRWQDQGPTTNPRPKTNLPLRVEDINKLRHYTYYMAFNDINGIIYDLMTLYDII